MLVRKDQYLCIPDTSVECLVLLFNIIQCTVPDDHLTGAPDESCIYNCITFLYSHHPDPATCSTVAPAFAFPRQRTALPKYPVYTIHELFAIPSSRRRDGTCLALNLGLKVGFGVDWKSPRWTVQVKSEFSVGLSIVRPKNITFGDHFAPFVLDPVLKLIHCFIVKLWYY